MIFDNLKITFYLEGDGIIYDRHNPIHFDALVDWLLSPMHRTHEPPSRTGQPQEINLPLASFHVAGQKIYKSSALFPVGGEEETIQYFRTKFPQEFIDQCVGSANLQSGLTRDHNRPYSATLCDQMVCYAMGKRKRIKSLLYRTHDSEGNALSRKKLKLLALGGKRNRGLGGIADIEVEKVDYDWSILKGGIAQRYLPDEEGLRECRLRPPYWNLHDMVKCCDVGDKYLFK